MGLYEDLVERALSLARGKRVKRVVINPFYAFAEIERGGSGLAFVDREIIQACCEDDSDSYWRKAADLIVKEYLYPASLKSTFSLAVMNAIFNNRKELLKEAIKEDPLDLIELSPEDEILMIGYFEPLMKKLQGRVRKIWVVEKPNPFQDLSRIEDFKKIKVAIITSATLSNKTLHVYFPYLEKIPEVILMGPSTPLSPEVFKYTPITWLSGSLVKESELLFRLVCEGKGAKSFFKSGALEKINLKIEKK
ncbi:MAG: Rossmann-like domain-containing protein [Caldimicrobium sp.]